MRWWFRLTSEGCFVSKVDKYTDLMSEWLFLTKKFKGWTLTEIQNLSFRERKNWVELAKAFMKE